MPQDKLAAAAEAYRKARQTAESRHVALKDVVVEAYQAGTGTIEIARRTGMDRESIRRIRVAAVKAGLLEAER
jgi:hypothetical protein